MPGLFFIILGADGEVVGTKCEPYNSIFPIIIGILNTVRFWVGYCMSILRDMVIELQLWFGVTIWPFNLSFCCILSVCLSCWICMLHNAWAMPKKRGVLNTLRFFVSWRRISTMWWLFYYFLQFAWWDTLLLLGRFKIFFVIPHAFEIVSHYSEIFEPPLLQARGL